MPLYFIAIVAPAHINTDVLAFKQYVQEHYGSKVALRSPAHITLIPPFHMAAEQEGELLKRLQFFWSQRKSFQVDLHHFDSFKPRVIFVDVKVTDELLDVKRSLEDFLFEEGYPIKKDSRPFHPHVTIANRDLPKKDFRVAWDWFRHQTYRAGFMADGISLLRSESDGWRIVGPDAANPPAPEQ